MRASARTATCSTLRPARPAVATGRHLHVHQRVLEGEHDGLRCHRLQARDGQLLVGHPDHGLAPQDQAANGLAAVGERGPCIRGHLLESACQGAGRHGGGVCGWGGGALQGAGQSNALLHGVALRVRPAREPRRRSTAQ
jgi:hypothetical protein